MMQKSTYMMNIICREYSGSHMILATLYLLFYRVPKSGEILMFVCNQVAKSREILMFVCLQKYAKQCCDATKLDCTHCAGHRPER